MSRPVNITHTEIRSDLCNILCRIDALANDVAEAEKTFNSTLLDDLETLTKSIDNIQFSIIRGHYDKLEDEEEDDDEEEDKEDEDVKESNKEEQEKEEGTIHLIKGDDGNPKILYSNGQTTLTFKGKLSIDPELGIKVNIH